MSFVVISGFTVKTQYEEEVKDLMRDLKRFNIPNEIFSYVSRGDWTKNTMVKAELFQEAMKKYPDKDIIWLDADAVIMQKPELFFELENHDFDICCHYLKTHYNPNELLSGTLAFRNNETTRQLVDDWVSDKEVNWDQKKLQKLVDGKYKDKLKHLPLPIEYIKIKRRNEHDVYNIGGVIGHKQVSRKQRYVLGYTR